MSGKNLFVITALVGLAVGLLGCNQDEQGRILSYEKGTYLGQADQKLGENQLRDLCLLYTSPSPRDATLSRMPSSA